MQKITCNIKYDYNYSNRSGFNLFSGLLSLAMLPIKKRISPKVSKSFNSILYIKNKNFMELQKITNSLNKQMPELLEVISRETNNYDWILEVSLSTHKPLNGENDISVNFFIDLVSATNKNMPKFVLDVIEEPEYAQKKLAEIQEPISLDSNKVYTFDELKKIQDSTLKQYYIVRPERVHFDISIESYRNYISKINKNTILFSTHELSSTNIDTFKRVLDSFDDFIKDKEGKGISPLKYGKYGYSYRHEFYIQKNVEWSIEIDEDIYDGDYFKSPFYPIEKTAPSDILKSIIESGLLKNTDKFLDDIKDETVDEVLKHIKLSRY